MARAAAAATKVKQNLCKQKIKGDDLEITTCNGRIVNERCQNKDRHILPFKTGFCNSGKCEGAALKDAEGVAYKHCMFWMTCPCDCHKIFDMMFREAEMPRVPVDNSGYVPKKSPFWMPSPEDRIAMMASSSPDPATAPVIIESPLPEAVPVTVRRTFAPTTTGRAARGELELWVKEQCDIWIVEEIDEPCTPVYLSNEIAKAQGIKAPSVGAISAVFDRWVNLGFAEIGKKPTRFIKYTPEGVKLGLEGCKEKARRARRSKEAEAGRRIGGRS